MDCHKVLCAECVTEWDGINYCARCLARRGRRLRSRRSWPGLLLILAVCAGLFWISTRLMVWSGVLAASLL